MFSIIFECPLTTCPQLKPKLSIYPWTIKDQLRKYFEINWPLKPSGKPWKIWHFTKLTVPIFREPIKHVKSYWKKIRNLLLALQRLFKISYCRREIWVTLKEWNLRRLSNLWMKIINLNQTAALLVFAKGKNYIQSCA